uniref:Uncharacterized protein n=1 Tax=Meloidogyne enterolobii TaxID=390850 RepID=A0A6V7UPV6_MELEN|nr:unnamed protein product [Meloidogyne enterolobii]
MIEIELENLKNKVNQLFGIRPTTKSSFADNWQWKNLRNKKPKKSFGF